MNTGFVPCSNRQNFSTDCINSVINRNDWTVLIPAPLFYLPGSSELYTISFDKAIPIIKRRGFGRSFPPLPLCQKCFSDEASREYRLVGLVCESCFNQEISRIMQNEVAKPKKKRFVSQRNNRICSTCSLKRACVKNGKKYKTCEDCLRKKKEEREKRICEERAAAAINGSDTSAVHKAL